MVRMVERGSLGDAYCLEARGRTGNVARKAAQKAACKEARKAAETWWWRRIVDV